MFGRNDARENVPNRPAVRVARPGPIYLCSVVLGKLIFGDIRSGPAIEPGNREMIADLMAQFVVLPFDEPAAVSDKTRIQTSRRARRRRALSNCARGRYTIVSQPAANGGRGRVRENMRPNLYGSVFIQFCSLRAKGMSDTQVCVRHYVAL
jgi:hypothetical protein